MAKNDDVAPEQAEIDKNTVWMTAPDELGGGDFPVSSPVAISRLKAQGYTPVEGKPKPGPAQQSTQRSGGPTQGTEKTA